MKPIIRESEIEVMYVTFICLYIALTPSVEAVGYGKTKKEALWNLKDIVEGLHDCLVILEPELG